MYMPYGVIRKKKLHDMKKRLEKDSNNVHESA